MGQYCFGYVNPQIKVSGSQIVMLAAQPTIVSVANLLNKFAGNIVSTTVFDTKLIVAPRGEIYPMGIIYSCLLAAMTIENLSHEKGPEDLIAELWIAKTNNLAKKVEDEYSNQPGSSGCQVSEGVFYRFIEEFVKDKAAQHVKNQVDQMLGLLFDEEDVLTWAEDVAMRYSLFNSGYSAPAISDVVTDESAESDRRQFDDLIEQVEQANIFLRKIIAKASLVLDLNDFSLTSRNMMDVWVAAQTEIADLLAQAKDKNANVQSEWNYTYSRYLHIRKNLPQNRR